MTTTVETTKVNVTTIHSKDRGKLKVSNTKIAVSAVLSDIESGGILSFPLMISPNTIEIDNNAETLSRLRDKSNYAIFDFDFYDEYAHKRLTDFLSPYDYYYSISKNDILNYTDKMRILFPVGEFTFDEYKLLGHFLSQFIKENEINCEITNRFNYYNNIIKPFGKEVEHNSGHHFNTKMIKTYRRPKNHSSYKKELYPIVLDIFMDLGFQTQNKLHPNVDKVYFTHSTGVGGYVWYPNSPFNLWHNDHQRKVNIYDIFAENHKYSDYIEKQTIEQKITQCGNLATINKQRVNLTKLDDTTDSFLRNWVKGAIFDSEERRPKNHNDVLCIRSPMGSAKTTLIKKVMDTHKTLIITPRTQLAIEFASKSFAQSYTQIEPIDYNRSLVCQFDSLYKFDLESFECFIIDEYMTLESHIAQCNPQTVAKNMFKLQYALESKVVLIDAMLTQNCLDIFSNKQRQVQWFENDCIDCVPLMHHKTFESFLKEIIKMEDKRITISCTSKNKLFEIKNYLDGLNFSTNIIVGETPNEERTKILKDYNDLKFNCLLYSPAISVGVSIESEVERHFHFDLGGIVSPIQSIQMLKRSRTSNQIEVYIQKRKRYGTTNIEEIRRQVIKDGLLCVYSKTGRQTLSQAGKTYAWMIRHDNIWRSEGKDSFDYLASLNFIVKANIEVEGSKNFNEAVIKKLTSNSEKWTPTLKQKALEYFNDNLIVEDFIEPYELRDFKYFYDLCLCLNKPDNIKYKKLEYYNKNNYHFENDLEFLESKRLSPFTRVINGLLNQDDATYRRVGFEKSMGCWILRSKFVKLFDALMAEDEIRSQNFTI